MSKSQSVKKSSKETKLSSEFIRNPDLKKPKPKLSYKLVYNKYTTEHI